MMRDLITAMPDRVRRIARWLVNLAFVLSALTAQPALALGTNIFRCDSIDMTVATIAPLAITPGTAAGAALGTGPITLKVTAKNCQGPADSTLSLIAPFGNTLAAANGVTGLNYRATSTPTATTVGTCPAPALSQNATQSVLTLQGVAYSGCTVTLTVPFRYFLAAAPARITGTQSVSANGPSAGGWYTYTSSCTSSCVATTVTIVTSSSSGNVAMPVYVAACAGVTNGTQTVQLPKVSTSTFAKGATTSSWIANTRFTISLGSCSSTATNAEGGNTTGYQAHITWSYTAAAGNATLVASTGTSNVAVSLLRSDNSPVRNDTDDVYTLTNGTNTFTYYATYYAPVQPATPGTVSATANFTVTYQ